jgi:hypothetical protein
MESLKRPNRISNARGPIPGASFFCGPAGEHQIHQHQEHTCIKYYHSLWIPLLYPVIDTSVTPGVHLDHCISLHTITLVNARIVQE